MSSTNSRVLFSSLDLDLADASISAIFVATVEFLLNKIARAHFANQGESNRSCFGAACVECHFKSCMGGNAGIKAIEIETMPFQFHCMKFFTLSRTVLDSFL